MGGIQAVTEKWISGEATSPLWEEILEQNRENCNKNGFMNPLSKEIFYSLTASLTQHNEWFLF